MPSLARRHDSWDKYAQGEDAKMAEGRVQKYIDGGLMTKGYYLVFVL